MRNVPMLATCYENLINLNFVSTDERAYKLPRSCALLSYTVLSMRHSQELWTAALVVRVHHNAGPSAVPFRRLPSPREQRCRHQHQKHHQSSESQRQCQTCAKQHSQPSGLGLHRNTDTYAITKLCLYNTLSQWYSTFFVRVPPDIISLQLCTPKVVGT
jgi:hypothetical protein